jgi:hypothetical protein
MESNILEAVGIDPGIVLILVVLFMIGLIIYMVKLSFKMNRFIRKYKSFMKGMDGASLEKSFTKKFGEMDKLIESNRNNMEEINRIKEIQSVTLNKTAIVKYDAFKEMGGKLSFALAMLDAENNGFVLNAIHSREGCYTYVKEIVKGESYIVLGEEEKEALRQAVNMHTN